MTQRFDLTGKVAVVTGAADGLGAASARALSEHGATVVLLDISLDGAQAVTDALPTPGLALRCDVSDQTEVVQAFATIRERFGHIEVLHNNAGVSFTGRGDAPPDELEFDMWQHIIGINLTGTFLCTKYALPMMVDRPEGASVINTGSIAGPVLGSTTTAYSAAKGGVVAMTRCLTTTHGGRGIRANVICPGSMDTKMAAMVKSRPDLRERFISQVPLGRQGLPEDIQGLVVFLASDSSSYFSGNVLVIDGGLHLV
ncbi:MAG: oxidoreductase, short chain dehydrogenase/reductase family [Marmoricola sp.]|nr:oxidoreductase, short chain dehydrogenase/reductase family [Marmoricola sp.]